MKKIFGACSISVLLLAMTASANASPLGDALLAKIEKEVSTIQAGMSSVVSTMAAVPAILTIALLPQNSQQSADFTGNIVATNKYQSALYKATSSTAAPLIAQFSGLSKDNSAILDQIFSTPTNYCDSTGNCASTLSSLLLYNADKYTESGAQTAAGNFVVNASGAGFALKPPPTDWYNSQTPEVQQYIAYYKTISAAHSVAINDFSEALASRTPANNNAENDSPRGQITNLSFLMFIQQTFQDTFAKLPVVGRLYSIDEKITGELIALHQMNVTLEKINENLDALNTIQTIQAQMLVGNNLYTQAQGALAKETKNSVDTEFLQNQQGK